MSRCILAIDPGTSCGYAFRKPDGQLLSGTWDLSPRRLDSPGVRWLKLRRALDELAGDDLVELLAFEEAYQKGNIAAHIYGGVIATLQTWAEHRQVTYAALHAGSVKKRATGKGNAKKPDMIRAAKRRWPDQRVDDENQADALWILAEAEATL